MINREDLFAIGEKYSKKNITPYLYDGLNIIEQRSILLAGMELAIIAIQEEEKKDLNLLPYLYALSAFACKLKLNHKDFTTDNKGIPFSAIANLPHSFNPINYSTSYGIGGHIICVDRIRIEDYKKYIKDIIKDDLPTLKTALINLQESHLYKHITPIAGKIREIDTNHATKIESEFLSSALDIISQRNFNTKENRIFFLRQVALIGESSARKKFNKKFREACKKLRDSLCHTEARFKTNEKTILDLQVFITSGYTHIHKNLKELINALGDRSDRTDKEFQEEAIFEYIKQFQQERKKIANKQLDALPSKYIKIKNKLLKKEIKHGEKIVFKGILNEIKGENASLKKINERLYYLHIFKDEYNKLKSSGSDEEFVIEYESVIKSYLNKIPRILKDTEKVGIKKDEIDKLMQNLKDFVDFFQVNKSFLETIEHQELFDKARRKLVFCQIMQSEGNIDYASLICDMRYDISEYKKYTKKIEIQKNPIIDPKIVNYLYILNKYYSGIILLHEINASIFFLRRITIQDALDFEKFFQNQPILIKLRIKLFIISETLHNFYREHRERGIQLTNLNPIIGVHQNFIPFYPLCELDAGISLPEEKKLHSIREFYMIKIGSAARVLLEKPNFLFSKNLKDTLNKFLRVSRGYLSHNGILNLGVGDENKIHSSTIYSRIPEKLTAVETELEGLESFLQKNISLNS